jgi:membrane fusion protein, adhesin transport system
MLKKQPSSKKPMKTITGTDANLAAAMQAELAKRGGAIPQKGLEEEVNEARAADTKRKMLQKAAAHAERFLDTDEDMPLGRHIILLSVCAFFFVFFIWASFAKLDETTRGQGKVIPSREIQKISTLEGGIVDELLVEEREVVKQGQPLARLRNIAATSEFGSTEERVLGLQATIARLEAEVKGTQPVFPQVVMEKAPQAVSVELAAYRANKDKVDTQTAMAQQQKSQRSQELNELSIKSNDLRGQMALIQEEKAMVAPLVAAGSAPKMELLQLDRSIKEKQTELNGVNAAMPRARSAIAEAESRIRDVTSSAKAQAQTELSAKSIELRSLQKGIVGLEDRRDRTEIKSPVNGIIQDIKVYTVGGVIQPGQDFIEVVPVDDKLIVEARIKPQDIAFLYENQPAMVKITAYDFSIYGGLKGKVIGISPDAVVDEKGESFYLVRVETDKNYLDKLGKDGKQLAIMPGMVATVDILTGQKTVLEYILKPFVKTLDNSLNER